MEIPGPLSDDPSYEPGKLVHQERWREGFVSTDRLVSAGLEPFEVDASPLK